VIAVACCSYIFNSIKSFDLSTLYTTITHTLLKSKIKELIQRYFSKKNGEQMYQYLDAVRYKYSFVKNLEGNLHHNHVEKSGE
jgi:predicted house-cleaning noncanonical NTP pyrophosphatase (MazG superfamily)